MSASTDKARAAWGDGLPQWVADLAAECDRTSQNKVALRMKRSAALISQVIGHKYPGDLAAVEEVFKGVFQAEVVTCPALGEMPANECRDWRAKAARFVSINSMRVQMYRACNRCPRHKGGVA
jgi:hypothetical protein